MSNAAISRTLVAGLVVGLLVLVSAVVAESPGGRLPDSTHSATVKASSAAMFPGAPLEELLSTASGAGFVVYTAGSCQAQATCWDGSMVSCSSSSSSGTCSYRDSACSPDPLRGYVRCDGVTTWCPSHTCGCSQYDTLGCDYFFNPETGCCDVQVYFGALCPRFDC